jgi:hypothetical protein
MSGVGAERRLLGDRDPSVLAPALLLGTFGFTGQTE